MKEQIENNDQLLPASFDNITIHFSKEAMLWLGGTTGEDNATSRFVLFADLLERMQLTAGRDVSFRRPQDLQPGQAQISEIGLAEQWKMGRKKIHLFLLKLEQLNLIRLFNDRTASIITFVCVAGWYDGGFIHNPFYIYSDDNENDH